MAQTSIHSADPPVAAGPASPPGAYAPVTDQARPGLIGRFMAALIRKLAWSRLASPRVAMGVTGLGLLLWMIDGATAPNAETLSVRLPLSQFLPPLDHTILVASLLLYAGSILACLGLAGMLWAHSQGWRPDPRLLLLASSFIVVLMVCLTPVGSSDMASYAAYGHITAQGGNAYITNPQAWAHDAYSAAVGTQWKTASSVYGPFATLIQGFAASIGGASVAMTIWAMMILNGAVFIGVGVLLLKTSDDPVRATLFWTANPVLIQQLVSGGHLDTIVAAAAICAIQVARRVTDIRGDIIVGVLIGLACGIKIYAVLIGIGLVWPMLRRHEWMRPVRMALAAAVTLGVGYSLFGLEALRPLFAGLNLVTLPSPWRIFELIGLGLGVRQAALTTIITCLWPIALFVVAWFIYHRISSDQPREVVAPFALTFAWVLVAPWVFAWYTAVAWAALTQVPRNPMTRWLAIVTVLLALCLSSGGVAALGR